MNTVEKAILAILIIYVLAMCAVTLARCGERRPMPEPEAEAEKYGCQIDEVAPRPGVMPGWMLHVWAEGKALAKRWSRLLAVHPPDAAGRSRALKDCDTWIRFMEQQKRRHRHGS